MLNRFYQKCKLNKIIIEKEAMKLPIKLHVGCGTVYLDGWINIDNNSDNNIKKLDVNWDLRRPLPIPDNTVDFIFNEHFLEHLTVEEGQKVLKDFLRILKPNGVMRIAMPDLKQAIYNYLHFNRKNDVLINKFGMKFIKTRGERINVTFRSWNHKWLYDAEELRRRLKEAGCINIRKRFLRKSEYVELQNLETREESALIMEIKK